MAAPGASVRVRAVNSLSCSAVKFSKYSCNGLIAQKSIGWEWSAQLEPVDPERMKSNQSNIIPAIAWLRGYERPWLRADILAGLIAAAVVIPKAMAFATIAGLPVQVGLYTAFVPMVVYALLGTSRPLSVSTTTTISILTAAEIEKVAPNGRPEELIAAGATLAVLVGAMLILASLLRLGFIANFISDPVLAGFKAGIGLVIVVDQVPKLLGIHIEKTGIPKGHRVAHSTSAADVAHCAGYLHRDAHCDASLEAFCAARARPAHRCCSWHSCFRLSGVSELRCFHGWQHSTRAATLDVAQRWFGCRDVAGCGRHCSHELCGKHCRSACVSPSRASRAHSQTRSSLHLAPPTSQAVSSVPCLLAAAPRRRR